MTKTVNVTVASRQDDGSGSGGVRIIRPEDVTFVSVPKAEKHGRVLQPVVFTRTSETMWELYVCVYREGEFRRLAMPLTQAREFLTDELNRVMAAITAHTKRMTEEKAR